MHDIWTVLGALGVAYMTTLAIYWVIEAIREDM